jgi:hypothetical protein
LALFFWRGIQNQILPVFVYLPACRLTRFLSFMTFCYILYKLLYAGPGVLHTARAFSRCVHHVMVRIHNDLGENQIIWQRAKP